MYQGTSCRKSHIINVGFSRWRKLLRSKTPSSSHSTRADGKSSSALILEPGIIPALRENPSRAGVDMADKVKRLGLERDYSKYLYFVDGNGNVSRKPKSGEGSAEVLVQNAVERDNRFLYFIDKDGDVARSERGTKKTKSAA